MITNILNIQANEPFNFRKFTNPNDELSYLFDEWVEYYHLKYSICKALEPRSILEIGVRYGYSAITFLSASPQASYVGIDNNSSTFGGQVGSFEWAKKITAGYKAEFIIADTQQMDAFPGDFYDLIHVDGQQDGDGTYRDLELALKKGKWILVDGFFWSNQNMLSATYFLKKYQKQIQYSVTIPGYAGELLIKTTLQADQAEQSKTGSYTGLQDSYDATYYLSDCGGYDSFKRTGGRYLEDARLLAIYDLADPRQGKTILDIGCGRGELAYALSQSGAYVTGIDYSLEAIAIAKGTFCSSNKHSAPCNLVFVACDVLTQQFDDRFDTIILSDVVEHLEQSALDKLLAKIATLLKNDGMLLLHTAPNRHNLLREYNIKRKQAQQIGSYLPKNPRTFYEDLMHINEQTPAKLMKALKRHFPHAITWTTALPDTLGSLRDGFSREQLAHGTSIFAVASLESLNKDLLMALLSQERLDANDVAVVLTPLATDLNLTTGMQSEVPIRVCNTGTRRLASQLPYPVHVSYHWVDEEGKMTVFDGIRTDFRKPLSSGEERDMMLYVIAPVTKGTYCLQVTLVQEGCFWFESTCNNFPVMISATVA